MAEVTIAAGPIGLPGLVEVPPGARGVVAFSHGSGSGRHSPRNRFVAEALRERGVGTLLLDLLTPEEGEVREARFDIALLSSRLADAVHFLAAHPSTRGLAIGLFGASTGAASALRVAAAMPQVVKAVFSRGGRPDLAGEKALPRVEAPTLLVVGGDDTGVIALNAQARDALAHCTRKLVLVPGASHLFEEPGALQEVARLAGEWFSRHLGAPDTLRS